MSTRRNEVVAISRIKGNTHNVRTHSKKQLRLIAESIKQFGFTSPILVDENYFTLAGHGRLAAADSLGIKEVPVVVVSGLTETQKRALLLADNKLVERAGYDRKALAIELDELAPLLAEAGLDVELTGFEQVEIDMLLADHVDPETDPLDTLPPANSTVVTRKGDLWNCGKHRLLCGDSCREENVARLMAGEKAAIVTTDPPYNQKINQVQGRGKIKHPDFLRASGDLSCRQFIRFLRPPLSLAAKHSVAGSIHYVFIDWRHAGELLAAGSKTYSELKNVIVWVKTNAGQGSFYRSQHEFIFVYKSGDSPHINNFGLGKHGRSRSNVWTYPGVNTFKAGRMEELSMHPTVKPVALIADALRDCSRRGDVVLDLFLGSGTTMLAAERVGRRAYGLEIDPRYVDVAVRRWQAYTKRDAILEGSGETFDEIASQMATPGTGAAR